MMFPGTLAGGPEVVQCGRLLPAPITLLLSSSPSFPFTSLSASYLSFILYVLLFLLFLLLPHNLLLLSSPNFPFTSLSLSASYSSFILYVLLYFFFCANSLLLLSCSRLLVSFSLRLILLLISPLSFRVILFLLLLYTLLPLPIFGCTSCSLFFFFLFVV